ncbi:RES family NAD+ phosphorylase [Aeromonas caviae]
MPFSDQYDEEDDKCICFNCVGDEYLSNELEQTGEIAQCSYCGLVAQSWLVEYLAERVEVAFNDHYIRTSDQPESWEVSLLADRESDYSWERSGTPILEAIAEAAGITDDAAIDVQEILAEKYWDYDSGAMGDESEFSSESHYEQKGPSDDAWKTEWHSFEKSLRSEARFFSKIASDHLTSIFGNIDKLKTYDGRMLVVNAGPQTLFEHLYRARVFQSHDKLKQALCRPDVYLGPPPERFATPGRMNALGISVFYGASEPHVALAEVRPPVGSNVAVANFKIIRPLRLLDLIALEDVHDEGSIFDPTFKNRIERVSFLSSLGRRITKPVMPDDQDLDYLATQAIADFLATENTPQLDGIIFRSAQSKEGVNVVLFHKAAKVEEMKFPKGTVFTAFCGAEYADDDEEELVFYVSEEVPSPALKKRKEPCQQAWMQPSLMTTDSSNHTSQKATLRVDPMSIIVHHINWVEVQSSSKAIERHRWKKAKLN